MLHQQLEVLLALDSCVLVEILKNSKMAKKVVRLFRGKHSRVVLQDVVFYEVEKILKIPREKILEKVANILHKEVYVFQTTDEIKSLAKRIEKQYGICHYPDSLILAASKIHSWALLTFDRDLLRAAEFEGTMAFNPSRLGGC